MSLEDWGFMWGRHSPRQDRRWAKPLAQFNFLYIPEKIRLKSFMEIVYLLSSRIGKARTGCFIY